MKSYQDINKETIDKWVEEGWEWGRPISHEDFVNAQNGVWNVFLTPTVPVPHNWLGDLKNKKILGLASGGGQQIPIFSALGGICSVLDNSSKQIETELKIAEREGYKLDALEGDMTKIFPYGDETFDIVFHPVSNCYVEDVYHVFSEAYRVLKKGGIFLAGLNNEINYIVDDEEREIVWKMPFNPLNDEKARDYLIKDDAGMQFSHNMTEQIGGQLKAGFTLLDIYEDTNGYGRLHELNIKSFIATKSRKL
ncbi:class I SAM-dependent methyltransferase [Citroniella saccharovorans]|uniref:Class I SAM-dependent methyltransferase n=1 Tax=Citroniella saccharovorans TaxID=2053367 RepID=A0AAW9MXS0_9FIRM|nr:class I SAM-dependent methyltransferase [Citroniella saccharovorans]MEB3429322.1 class I SAM-dependent methyltransferase [Citroniella saccharovorans]